MCLRFALQIFIAIRPNFVLHVLTSFWLTKDVRRRPTSNMASCTLLELPPEIRNKIYRHTLCYDGITPEVTSPWNPWQSRTYIRPWIPLPSPGDDSVTERPGLRVHLDVIAPIRNGIYPRAQLPVLASDILTLLRTCRQIYKEAHSIFWAENAFVFPDQDSMHAFTHGIGAKSFDLIRTLAIEKTADAEWINVNGCIDLGYWFADVRITPFLQALHLREWEIKFEDYYCHREHWVLEKSDPSEMKIRKLMIPCKTTYNWLTRPPTGHVTPVGVASGVIDDGLYDICALRYSLRRHCVII